jgi:hypothetical protein
MPGILYRQHIGGLADICATVEEITIVIVRA